MEVDEVCNPSALVGFDGVAGVSKVQHKRATTEAPVFQYLVLPQVQNLRKVTTIISWLSRKKDNLVQLKKLLGGGAGVLWMYSGTPPYGQPIYDIADASFCPKYIYVFVYSQNLEM